MDPLFFVLDREVGCTESSFGGDWYRPNLNPRFTGTKNLHAA
jgi:hypothetical protein